MPSVHLDKSPLPAFGLGQCHKLSDFGNVREIDEFQSGMKVRDHMQQLKFSPDGQVSDGQRLALSSG
jgi:hypothetical protein